MRFVTIKHLHINPIVNAFFTKIPFIKSISLTFYTMGISLKGISLNSDNQRDTIINSGIQLIQSKISKCGYREMLLWEIDSKVKNYSIRYFRDISNRIINEIH